MDGCHFQLHFQTPLFERNCRGVVGNIFSIHWFYQHVFIQIVESNPTKTNFVKNCLHLLKKCKLPKNFFQTAFAVHFSDIYLLDSLWIIMYSNIYICISLSSLEFSILCRIKNYLKIMATKCVSKGWKHIPVLICSLSIRSIFPRLYYVSSGLTLLVEMSNHLQQKESKRKGNGPLLPAKRMTAFRDGSLEKMIAMSF